MAGDTTLTIVGNLTADPELRFTSTGTAVANFTVASTPRSFDRSTGQWVDGDPLFLRCTAWAQLAEHAAESLTKGMRVIVAGRLRQRSFQTREGDKRSGDRARRRRGRPLAALRHRHRHQNHQHDDGRDRRRRRERRDRAPVLTRARRRRNP